MSDPDGDDEWIKDRIAFEARFPLAAFEPIAKALRKSTGPRSLQALRGWLLPHFYFLHLNCTGNEPTRDERIKGLIKLREAATTLISSAGIGGIWMELTGGVLKAAWDGQFKATVQRLADEADEQIRKLSKPDRGGRPSKDAFRQLSSDLVRVYEGLKGEPARKPHWIAGSVYGGDFFEFAEAVWCCLRTHLPDVQNELPGTASALGDGLRRNWVSIRKQAGEKPLALDK
ncbi:MAG TPA: hypothetical protein VJX94_15005 [Stellaceae bacterium]|nr:hypothetical protein [Stellaceae bacterium]